MCERNKAFICESGDFIYFLFRGEKGTTGCCDDKFRRMRTATWKWSEKACGKFSFAPSEKNKLQMPIISKFPFKQMYSLSIFILFRFVRLVMCKKQLNNFMEILLCVQLLVFHDIFFLLAAWRENCRRVKTKYYLHKIWFISLREVILSPQKMCNEKSWWLWMWNRQWWESIKLSHSMTAEEKKKTNIASTAIRKMGKISRYDFFRIKFPSKKLTQMEKSFS